MQMAAISMETNHVVAARLFRLVIKEPGRALLYVSYMKYWQ